MGGRFRQCGSPCRKLERPGCGVQKIGSTPRNDHRDSATSRHVPADDLYSKWIGLYQETLHLNGTTMKTHFAMPKITLALLSCFLCLFSSPSILPAEEASLTYSIPGGTSYLGIPLLRPAVMQGQINSVSSSDLKGITHLCISTPLDSR